MLNVLRLPSGKLEHLAPKIERVTGWAEDYAETLYWPIARLFVPGEGGVACNRLCDIGRLYSVFRETTTLRQPPLLSSQPNQ